MTTYLLEYDPVDPEDESLSTAKFNQSQSCAGIDELNEAIGRIPTGIKYRINDGSELRHGTAGISGSVSTNLGLPRNPL